MKENYPSYFTVYAHYELISYLLDILVRETITSSQKQDLTEEVIKLLQRLEVKNDV